VDITLVFRSGRMFEKTERFTIKNWQLPIPRSGDYVESDKKSVGGEVSRVEFDIDKQEIFVILIHSG